MGKDPLPRSTIRYSGLFDFDGLYAAIIDWAKNYGYMWHEIDYKHKVPSPAGAEQEWKWSLIKRISKSHRYEILFTLHSWDLQEVVVEYDNKKKTLTKGRIYIWIDPKPTPYSISMATNVVPRIFPESHIPGLGEIKKVFIKAEEESKKYNFDTSQNQVKEFYIGEKKFVVRLIEIKNIVFEDPTTGVKSETSAYEYVFQIREIE